MQFIEKDLKLNLIPALCVAQQEHLVCVCVFKLNTICDILLHAFTCITNTESQLAQHYRFSFNCFSIRFTQI